VQKNVPISLLIMSRTFFLQDEMVSGESETVHGSSDVVGLADAMSGIDKEVVNEIILEMASSEEKSKNADVMKIQLEFLEQQNEMIKEEQEERDAAAKEKEEKSEEKENITEEEALAAVDDKPAATDFSASADAAISGDKLYELNEEEVEDEEQTELSTEEIDAISQLTSPDPVLREREELKRIKERMQEESEADIDHTGEQEGKEASVDASPEIYSSITPSEPFLTEEAAAEIVEIVKEIENEAKEITEVPMQEDTEAEDELVGDAKLQKAIDRLKTRVESMVGKIETQLSDVEGKIGDKLYLLDKDGDGVLTMEEMAQVLQTVLKRDLTAEEAMAIAMDMDQNKDGVFSIAELTQWAETNTIAKLAEDGREKDLDDFITERVAVLKGKEKGEGQTS